MTVKKICMGIYIEFLFVESINFATTGPFSSRAVCSTAVAAVSRMPGVILSLVKPASSFTLLPASIFSSSALWIFDH